MTKRSDDHPLAMSHTGSFGEAATAAGARPVFRARHRRHARLARLWPLVAMLLLVLGPVAGWLAYNLAADTIEQRTQLRFEEELQLRAQKIQEQITSYAEVLHSCHGLYDASEHVTQAEFGTFTQQARGRHPCIDAVAWAPRSEIDGQPSFRLAYIEPLERHRQLLRMDLLESDGIRQALQAALGETQPVITAPVVGALSGHSASAHGLLVLAVHAIRSDGSQGAPRGAVVLSFDFADLMAAGSVAGSPRGMRLFLFDVTAGDTAQLAGVDGKVTEVAPGFSAQTQLEVGGRTWRLSALPTQHFLALHESRAPLGIAAAVFLVWEPLAGLLLALSHASRSNAVRRQGRNVARIMQSLGEGVVVAAADGHVRLANAAARVLFGTVMDDKSARDFERAVRFERGDDKGPFLSEDAPLRRAMRGEVFDQERCIVYTPSRPSGVHVSVNGSPLRDEWGNLLGGVLAIRDDTERRQAEDELRAKDAKLRQRQVEMDLAADVQKGFYPSAPPDLEGLDVSGAVRPADETCGDYYDFLELPDGSLLLAIGDVSGHGLGPALVMAETRAYVRSLARAGNSPGEILELCNAQLCADLADDLFVTMLLIRVSKDARQLSYASAGHTPALLLSADGDLKREMARSGPPLGIVEGARYRMDEGTAFEDDDVLILMTDGVTEAASDDGSYFEEEGVLEAARRHRQHGSARILREIHGALDGFAGERSRRDDVTLVVCKRTAMVEAPVHRGFPATRR